MKALGIVALSAFCTTVGMCTGKMADNIQKNMAHHTVEHHSTNLQPRTVMNDEETFHYALKKGGRNLAKFVYDHNEHYVIANRDAIFEKLYGDMENSTFRQFNNCDTDTTLSASAIRKLGYGEAAAGTLERNGGPCYRTRLVEILRGKK